MLFFSCRAITAQDSFLSTEDNPNWKIVNTVTSYPEIKTTIEYKLEKDTLINSILYQKITNDAGYIRLSNNKVFYRLKEKDKDYLLYNFDLNVNDTVYCGFYLNENYDSDTVKFWVVQIDSLTLEDGKHKRLKMNFNPLKEDSSFIFSMDWIEGVGSTSHPFYSSFLSVAPGSISELLCFHLGETKIYQNPSYTDCNVTSSVNDVEKKNKIQIYSSLCSSYLIVQNIEQGTILNIFNSQGQIILSYSLEYPEFMIQTDSWLPGIYFVQVVKGNISILKQKITKQ